MDASVHLPRVLVVDEVLLDAAMGAAGVSNVGSPGEITVDELSIDACDFGERRPRRTARSWGNVIFAG